MVIVQRDHTNVLLEEPMKFSWILGIIKGIEAGLVGCPKYHNIWGETGEMLKKKKVIKERKMVTSAWRPILLLFWMVNLHFLLSYVRESLCLHSKGKLEEGFRTLPAF